MTSMQLDNMHVVNLPEARYIGIHSGVLGCMQRPITRQLPIEEAQRRQVSCSACYACSVYFSMTVTSSKLCSCYSLDRLVN